MDYRAFHQLSYGLYTVTTRFGGVNAGFIANTVFQVTSSPPQVAVSCHKNNNTLGFILKSRIFSISVLKKDASEKLIGEFGYMSGRDMDKFAHVHTEEKVTGAPVVTDSAVAWLDCRLVNTVDTGTHMLLIAEVVDSGLLSEDEPLTYAWYREKYKLTSPKNSPTYLDKEKLGAFTEPRKPVTEIRKPETDTAKPETIEEVDNEPYICSICGHIYNPEEGDMAAGIPPGTPFSDLPEDYRCPICNAGKDYFRPMH